MAGIEVALISSGMKSLLLTIFLIAFNTSCSHRAAESRVEPEGIASEGIEGSQYTAVQFSPGESVLTEENKKFLNQFARRADGREIAEIKILAWADREYPSGKSEKVKTREVILANERANVIRNFLRKDLRSNDPIDVFNMAKKPGVLEKLLKNEDFQVKEDVAASGVTATRLPGGQTSYTKAGKVLVIFDYKDMDVTKK